MLDQLSDMTDDLCLCNGLIIHGYAQASRQIVLLGTVETMGKCSIRVTIVMDELTFPKNNG